MDVKRRNKMSTSEMTSKLEDLILQASVIRSTFLAVNDAIIEGPNELANFEWALYGVHSQICRLQEELEQARDKSLETLRADINKEKEKNNEQDRTTNRQ